jgi:HSP20 family protein
MKLVRKQSDWLPTVLSDLLAENRLDVPNYENFSIPAVNIFENLTTFVVELAVPGLTKEDFTIEIEENLLKVASEVKKETETSDTNADVRYTRKEFSFSNFKRTFTLPENIKSEDVKAKYENGVLQIALPKKEEEKELKKMVEIS